MDGSRVTQGLDFLWFYTNVLTCTHDEPAVASLTDQCSPSDSTHANEPPKPHTPVIVNHQQHHESQHAEDLTTMCLKCGEISSAFEEERVMHAVNSEMKSGKEKKKRDGRKRRKKKWNKSGLNGTQVILGGGLDLGFDAERVNNGFLKLQDEPYEYEMIKTKLPPFDDDVAMKQHLKSWAYAVACTVNSNKAIWKL